MKTKVAGHMSTSCACSEHVLYIQRAKAWTFSLEGPYWVRRRSSWGVLGSSWVSLGTLGGVLGGSRERPGGVRGASWGVPGGVLRGPAEAFSGMLR